MFRLIFRSKTFIVVAFAIFTYGLTWFFPLFPSITEKYYSRGLYPYLSKGLSFISGSIPFSLDDSFYVLLVFLFLTIIVLLVLRRISFKRFLFITVNSIAVAYIAFYWLWGFNYFREPLNKRLHIPEAKPDTGEFLDVLSWLIGETNQSYIAMDSINREEVQLLIDKSYLANSSFIKTDIDAGGSMPKSITFSRFFASATISGYYGPFFNEVHVNSYLLPVEYPTVLAHEKAHRLGVASEAEANFYAWFICNSSGDKRLMYSANLYLLRFFIYEGCKLDGFKEKVNELREEVKADYRKVNEHWLSLMNKKVEEVATKVNDTYLKTNKVEKGIGDYEGVVKYVMDYKSFKKVQSLK